jgi:hypothetical protein
MSPQRCRHQELFMTDKITPPLEPMKKTGVTHPGMMGDGTEEQNLNETGNPADRIEKDDVTAAFAKQPAKK